MPGKHEQAASRDRCEECCEQHDRRAGSGCKQQQHDPTDGGCAGDGAD
jgi:hypothetical protein